MIGGRLVGGSVVRGFNETPGKNMFGVVIPPVQFDRGFFCYSIFFFFYIGDKEKINLIARSSHSSL